MYKLVLRRSKTVLAGFSDGRVGFSDGAKLHVLVFRAAELFFRVVQKCTCWFSGGRVGFSRGPEVYVLVFRAVVLVFRVVQKCTRWFFGRSCRFFAWSKSVRDGFSGGVRYWQRCFAKRLKT